MSLSAKRVHIIDPTQSHTNVAIPVRIDRKISNRWRYWEPRVIIYTQSHPLGASAAEIRSLHYNYCIHLILRYNLSIRDLVRTNLDNPLIPQKQRDRILSDYFERCQKYRAATIDPYTPADSPTPKVIVDIPAPGPTKRVYNLSYDPFVPGGRVYQRRPLPEAPPSSFRKPNWRMNGIDIFTKD